MKKLIALILVVALAASAFCLEAFAASYKSQEASGTYHGGAWRATLSAQDARYDFATASFTTTADKGNFKLTITYHDDVLSTENTKSTRGTTPYGGSVTKDLKVPQMGYTLLKATAVYEIDKTTVKTLTTVRK